MSTVRRIEGSMPVSFRYTPGVGTTTFLEALRDRGVLLGARCDACGITYLPARAFCERCLAELTPGVECGPEGVLESFTIVHVDDDDRTVDPPDVVGLVRVDGADTVLLHRLLDVADPEIGMRLRARVKERREGSILDLEGFEPA
jgi:uncharacterized OB-fold protein